MHAFASQNRYYMDVKIKKIKKMGGYKHLIMAYDYHNNANTKIIAVYGYFLALQNVLYMQYTNVDTSTSSQECVLC